MMFDRYVKKNIEEFFTGRKWSSNVSELFLCLGIMEMN